MSIESGMMERWGVLAAMLSSALGGAAVGATRYLAGAIDPIALGSLRFGLGFVLLLPLALLQRRAWPGHRDWIVVAGLGVLFFAIFPWLFNASLQRTTAARGALALSSLPLLTMVAASLLRVEALSIRKSVGVLVASCGVLLTLSTGLADAPPGAWRGDLLMVAAALCMAFYSVLSRAPIRRSDPITTTAVAMGVGSACLIGVSALDDRYRVVAAFTPAQWAAVAYLGVFGGAIVFFLWSYALKHTTPTRVAVSVTVNPVAAAWVGLVLLDEPIRWSLALGLLAVLVGIAIASSRPREKARPGG